MASQSSRSDPQLALVVSTPAQRRELEAAPHLVELADGVQVGSGGREPAVGVADHETLGVEAGQGLPNRRAGHVELVGQRRLAQPDTEREVADQQPMLQIGVGLDGERWSIAPAAGGGIPGCIHCWAP